MNEEGRFAPSAFSARNASNRQMRHGDEALLVRSRSNVGARTKTGRGGHGYLLEASHATRGVNWRNPPARAILNR